MPRIWKHFSFELVEGESDESRTKADVVNSMVSRA